MANERIPEDPNRSGLSDDDFYRSSRFDDGAPSGGKVALFAVGIALLLGAVFYGLNNSSVHQATNPPPAQTAQGGNQGLPQAPPGMRDVTPRTNTEPGQTTGAAPSRTMPPATAPSTMNRPPSDNRPRQ